MNIIQCGLEINPYGMRLSVFLSALNNREDPSVAVQFYVRTIVVSGAQLLIVQVHISLAELFERL